MLPFLIFFSLLSLPVSYRYLSRYAFRSPLSKLPNAHVTSSICGGWILWQRYFQTEVIAIHHAHEKFGPIVRLGPNEISINCVDGGIKTVYGANFDKHEWYSLFANFEYTVVYPSKKPTAAKRLCRELNLFSTIKREPHSIRKRMFASVYNKSTIQSSPEINQISRYILKERFLPIIEAAAETHNSVEMLELGFAVAMDFTAAYLFGLSASTSFLQEPAARKRWIAAYRSIKPYGFWLQEIHGLYAFLSALHVPVVPRWVSAAVGIVTDLGLEMCRKVESCNKAASLPNAAEDAKNTAPVVYDQLSRSLTKSDKTESSSCPTKAIASELMDHLVTGSETSGVTLTYLMHELSKRPGLQSSLRSELLSLSPPLKYLSPQHLGSISASSINLPTPNALDDLPLLDAILTETLRLHSPVPGPQPRVTPASRTTLAGHADIPGGVRVSAQAYSLHRNKDVFPDPDEWKPERWLEASREQRDEMMRWFWAFGSGARACIGRWFAVQILKLIVAAIYTTYTTEIVDDAGIEQADGYNTGPKGNKLILQFQRAESGE